VVEHNHTEAFIIESPETLYAKGQVAKIPWITGVNRDEGEIFTLCM